MVAENMEGCLPCLATTEKHEREPMQHVPLPSEPWQHLSCDYYGPTHTGDYLLVFVDLYSRFPVVRYTKSTGHEPAIRAIDNILAEFGNITQLDTDNGPPFNS